MQRFQTLCINNFKRLICKGILNKNIIFNIVLSYFSQQI